MTDMSASCGSKQCKLDAIADGYLDGFAWMPITVTEVDGNDVKFRPKASKTEYSMKWDEDVWTKCPHQVALEKGASGYAYLGRAYDRLDPETQGLARKKWPEADPQPSPFKDCRLSITRIRVTGLLDTDTQVREVELQFPDAGSFALDLRTCKSEVTFQEGGATRTATMEIFEVSISGKGGSSASNIEMLVPAYGDPYQVMQVFPSDQLSIVRLGQAGLAAFGLAYSPNARLARVRSKAARPDFDLDVITFVATPADPKQTDRNDVNEKIARALSEHHEVFRVSSLFDIASHLQDRERAPSLVQIVGHGTPGMLALDYHWSGKYYDDKGFATAVDSNPYSYGALAPFIRPGTRVVLAGCEVGSDLDSSSLVAGGSELVFDLYKMWGCEVFAADTMVTSVDFEKGIYVGAAVGMTNNGWTRVHAQRVYAPVPVDAVRPSFSRIEIVAAPILGERGQKVTAPLSSVDLSVFDEEVTLPEKSPAALDEVQMMGTVNGEPAELALIAGTRLLRVKQGGTERYFRQKRRPAHISGRTSGADGIWRAIRAVLRTSR